MQIQDGNTAANQADAGAATATVDTTGAGSAAPAETSGANPGTVATDGAGVSGASAGAQKDVAATVTPHLSLLAQLEADVSAAFDKADAAETAAIAGIKASVDQFIAKTRALLSL